MAYLTILEAAKLGQGTLMDRAIVQIFAQSAPILQYLPFRNIPGNAIKYNREQTLPGIAWRGINEGYTASTGIINPIVESLFICGGDIQVDRFIEKTEGPGARAVHVAMKAKAISQDFQRAFIKGDSLDDPKEIDGLQTRLVGDQLIAAGTTDGGDALSLAKLDELIDAVDGGQYLIMGKAMARRMTTAGRTSTVAGNIEFSKDEFGATMTKYNGLPIIALADSAGLDNVLPFEEATNHTTATATGSSIYCVAFGPDKLSGLQNGALEARDLGEMDSAPLLLTRIEWDIGMMIRHGRSAARLWSVKNAAVTA
jgi:hypothetical protein